MKRACNRLWEVDALREGRLARSDEESFARHRRVCEDCRQRLLDDERLRELGRSLPVVEPDELRARRMRGLVLQHAATGPVPRRRAWLVLAAAAMLVALVATSTLPRRSRLARTTGRVPPLELDEVAAVVTPEHGAEWQRERDATTERVRLVDGTVTLAVRHREPGQRFLVSTPDAEIEVRGTRFEVVVRARKTVRVRVFEGTVALRRQGDRERLLVASEAWVADEPDRAPVVPTMSPDQLPIASATPSSTPVVGAAAARGALGDPSAAYQHAMDLYAAHDYEGAARELHAFADKHASVPEAEDASFLEAASLARAGRADAAAVVAERFLSRYPSSFHAKDAAIVVARGARARGDCAKARAVLAPWSGASPPADVANALASCAGGAP